MTTSAPPSPARLDRPDDAAAYTLSFTAKYEMAESAVFHAALRLGLTDALAAAGRGLRSPEGLAAATGASPRGIRIVAETLAGSGAIAAAGGGFALSSGAAQVLADEALAPSLRDATRWWRPARRLPDAVRSGEPVEDGGNTWDLLGHCRRTVTARYRGSDARALWVDRTARGFLRTQVLVAAGEVGVLEVLRDGPQRLPDLARAVSASPEGVAVLLDVLERMGIVVPQGEGPGLDPAVARILEGRNLGTFLHGLRITSHFWEALGRLDEAVAGDRRVLDLQDPEQSSRFYLDLARFSTAIFPSYLASIAGIPASVAAIRGAGPAGSGGGLDVLDVGAGSGVWGAAFSRADPAARVTYLDQPKVLAQARRNVHRLGLGDRSRFLPRDLFGTAFPTAAFDVAILGQICHTQHPSRLPELLGRLARALRPGGVVVLADFVLEDERTGPLEYLLFGVKEFVTTQGEVLTYREYDAQLAGAGLAATGLRRLPGIDVILARAAGAPEPVASRIPEGTVRA